MSTPQNTPDPAVQGENASLDSRAKSALRPDEPKVIDPLTADDDDEDDTGVHPHQDELLDEGIEETFPASDPVSVKHIT